MATVPLYSSQVRPSESINAFMESPESKGREGQALAGLGADMMAEGERLGQQKSMLEAQQALSKAADEERTFLVEEFKKEGTNAFDAPSRGMSTYTSIGNKYTAGLSNEASRIFGSRFVSMRDSGLDKLAGHEAQQIKIAKEASITNSISQIYEGINNGSMTTGDIDARFNDWADQMRTFNSGKEIEPLIRENRQKLLTTYLTQQATVNPDSLKPLVDQFKGELPAEVVQKVMAHGEMSEALRDMWVNPDEFNPSKYKNLNPEQKERLVIQADKLSETRLNRQIANEARAEREADRAEKKERELYDYQVLSRWTSQDPKTGQRGVEWGQIEQLLQRRKISMEMYKYLLQDKTTENNPLVVGDLASQIEMGRDVTDDLNAALYRGDVKKETFIQFMKNMGNNAYKEGLTSINAVLKPGEFDKWDGARNLKYDDALTYYHQLISEGKKPKEASDIVLEGHRSKLHRTMQTMAMPRYLTGKREDGFAVIEAQRKTQEAYANGLMGDSEYKYEMDLLAKYRQMAIDAQRSQIQKPETSTTKSGTESKYKPTDKKPAY